MFQRFPFHIVPVAWLSGALLLSGCASNGAAHRPKVSNDQLVNYEADLRRCQQLAKAYDGAELAQGGVLGAISGALVGDGSDESIAGAAIGAVIGVTGGSFRLNAKRRQIVVDCMREQGYNVRD